MNEKLERMSKEMMVV